MIQHLNLDIWKDYFRLSFLISVGNYISIEAEKMKFNFFLKNISGTLKMEPFKTNT